MSEAKTCDCFQKLDEELCCNISGNCEASGAERGLTNCIHCGAELREVDGDWFHHSQFEDGFRLLPDQQPQDFVRTVFMNV